MKDPTTTFHRPVADPLIVTRAFKIDQPLAERCDRLIGQGDYQWTPGPNRAECRRHLFSFYESIDEERLRFRRAGPCLSPPSADGTCHRADGCGISAFHSPLSLLAVRKDQHLLVVGEIRLWGTIRGDGVNYRAEWGEIHRLWSTFDNRHLGVIARRYGVPIVAHELDAPPGLDCDYVTTAEIPAYARLIELGEQLHQIAHPDDTKHQGQRGRLT